MPLVRKRRTQPTSDDEDDVPSRTQRRRALLDLDNDANPDEGDEERDEGAVDLVMQSAKKLVRYALACEYSRQPIRRADIGQFISTSSAKNFREVFDQAQLHLEDVFAMKMVELPLKEKITMQERRGANTKANERQNATSRAWILVTTLPSKYRDPQIIPPPKLPTQHAESSYVGLTSFVVSLIYLSGGQLSESKLARHLRRTNADHTTPLDKTEKLLMRMAREGYIMRVKERTTGGEEPLVEYHVGPRGKVEIGESGVTGLMEKVYNGLDEDLTRQLNRTLDLGRRPELASTGNNTAEGRRNKRRPRQAQQSQRRGQTHEQDASEEESDEEESASD